MLGSNFIRNSLHYLMAKPSNQRWASTIAAANQLQAKNLQETALAENCILVDEFDRAIGQSSKRDCHRVDENGRIKLHRAFSVFLFNTNGDMLIQKRSSHKVNVTHAPFFSSFSSLSISMAIECKVNIELLIFIFTHFSDYLSRLLHKRLLQSSTLRYWVRKRWNKCNGNQEGGTKALKLWAWNSIEPGIKTFLIYNKKHIFSFNFRIFLMTFSFFFGQFLRRLDRRTSII